MTKPWEKVGPPHELAAQYGRRLIRQTFRRPSDGSEHDFFLFGQPDWSVVFALTEDHRLIVVEQYKQGCDAVVLELPAGVGADGDADAAETMKRELREETGFQASSMVATGIPVYIATRSSWTRFHTFLATGCVRVDEPKLDPTEEIETHLLTIDDWLARCANEVVECSALVATYRALAHLGMAANRRPAVGGL